MIMKISYIYLIHDLHAHHACSLPTPAPPPPPPSTLPGHGKNKKTNQNKTLQKQKYIFHGLFWLASFLFISLYVSPYDSLYVRITKQ